MAIKVSKYLNFKIINFYNYCNLDKTNFNLLELIKKLIKILKFLNQQQFIHITNLI